MVTGASGFIGRQVCDALAQRGWRVRALSRTGAGMPQRVEVVRYEGLNDAVAIGGALRGASIVVHLAARVHVMREADRSPIDAFRAVNVEGTRILLEAMSACGVRRLAYASSVKAVADSAHEPLTAETKPRPADPYGISKRESELLISEWVRGTGHEAVMVRLPVVYGPGMQANMLRLFRAVDRGLPLPVPVTDNRRSIVYCGTVASAFAAIAASPEAGARCYFLADPRALSTRALVTVIAQALERRPRYLPLSPGALRIGARLGDRLQRIAPMPLTSRHLDRLLGSLEVDPRPFYERYQFTPVDTPDAMRVTAHWFRGTGAHRLHV